MKVTIKINNQDIEAEIKDEDVAKIVKPKKKLRPEVGEVYYILYGDASVGGSILGNDPKDLRYWNAGNGFFTKKEADKESDKHRAIQRVKDYIIEHDMEFSPDWSNGSQYKYYPYYDESTKKVSWNCCWQARSFLPFSYLGSTDHIVQLTKDCQDDLVIIFDKK